MPKSSTHCFKKHEAAGSKRSDVFIYRKNNHVGKIETVDELPGSTKVQSQVFIPFQIKSCHTRNVHHPTSKLRHLIMTLPGEQEQRKSQVGGRSSISPFKMKLTQKR